MHLTPCHYRQIPFRRDVSLVDVAPALTISQCRTMTEHQVQEERGGRKGEREKERERERERERE